jgi:hypothetical protein
VAKRRTPLDAAAGPPLVRRHETRVTRGHGARVVGRLRFPDRARRAGRTDARVDVACGPALSADVDAIGERLDNDFHLGGEIAATRDELHDRQDRRRERPRTPRSKGVTAGNRRNANLRTPH